MSRILADREIRKLLSVCLKSADEKLLNPNGIEVRLGGRVRFISTGEEFELAEGKFLRVSPGESVVIASLESLDFSKAAVQQFFPDCMLMGWITPTTTMMREGISQVATKVDAGFVGQLNWLIRNSSYKDLTLQYGESVFKLTLELLEGNEVPEKNYGERTGDRYQNTSGILLSSRKLPADIPANRVVASSRHKLDPKVQLREAGHPFDHIGSELVQLQGKFEMVSKDVLLMKDNFEQRTTELSSKIESETGSVLKKMEESNESIKEHVDYVFSRKFSTTIGTILAAITVMLGAWGALQKSQAGTELILLVSLIAAVAIFFITLLVATRAT